MPSVLELMKTVADQTQLLHRALEVIKVNEWQCHHAAENHYCPYCADDDDLWMDQKEHHPGCAWVELVGEIEAHLNRGMS